MNLIFDKIVQIDSFLSRKVMLLRCVKYKNDFNNIRRQVQAQGHAQRYYRRASNSTIIQYGPVDSIITR